MDSAQNAPNDNQGEERIETSMINRVIPNHSAHTRSRHHTHEKISKFGYVKEKFFINNIATGENTHEGVLFVVDRNNSKRVINQFTHFYDREWESGVNPSKMHSIVAEGIYCDDYQHGYLRCIDHNMNINLAQTGTESFLNIKLPTGCT